MNDKNLNTKKEIEVKELTPEEKLIKTEEEFRRAQQVEIEMKKIRERMQQRLREANTEESLKRQEVEQKAKVEALRQKLQREKQAQLIREMAERNAVEHKAIVKAAQIAERKEQEARETGRTSDFDLEEKRKKMMDAYYTQQNKVKARQIMGTEVDLELAEDDLKETRAAQKRMEDTENVMKELRAEQAKKIEEEKKQKTSAIKNIFDKLTSWPRRKIPTQEELNSDSMKEGDAAVNTSHSKENTENLRTSESASSINERVISAQESSEELSYQDKKLKELYDVLVNRNEMTKEEADKRFEEVRKSERIKKQAEEARKEAEIAKAKEEQRKLHKMSYAAQQYFSKLFNPGQKLSRKDNTKTKNNLIKNLRCQVDEELAFQNYLQKAQNNKEKESSEYIGPEYV